MRRSRRRSRAKGSSFNDVRTGACLNKARREPGKPCLTLETLPIGDCAA